MMTTAPITQHREWRYLLREFRGANRQMQQYPHKLLELLLSPAACIAWWITKFHPELLQRDSLHLVVAGAEAVETSDQGRWLSFLPWLCGRPEMYIQVTLVGDNVVPDGEDSTVTRGVIDLEATGAMWQTPLASAVRERQPARMFNGLLRELRASEPAAADAYVFFAPGLELYHSAWITERDMLPLLRQRIPIAMFPHSRADATSDLHLFDLYGLKLVNREAVLCPWRVGDDDSAVAMFAHSCLDVQVDDVPKKVPDDRTRIDAYGRAMEYLSDDLTSFGIMCGEHVGEIREVPGSDNSAPDRFIMLPRMHAVRELTGEAGSFDSGAFSRFDPPVTVPLDVIHQRPQGRSAPEMLVWAAQLHQRHVAPMLAKARYNRA